MTPHPAIADKQAAEQAQTKVLDFAARIDTKLDDLPLAERGPFLSKLLVRWLADYQKFLRAVDSGDEPETSMDAFDYMACINEITVRRERLGGGQ